MMVAVGYAEAALGSRHVTPNANACFRTIAPTPVTLKPPNAVRFVIVPVAAVQAAKSAKTTNVSIMAARMSALQMPNAGQYAAQLVARVPTAKSAKTSNVSMEAAPMSAMWTPNAVRCVAPNAAHVRMVMSAMIFYARN